MLHSEITWHPNMTQTEDVLWQLQNRATHDPDFGYFKRFAGQPGLFIDMGANRGQSAVSIRLAWPECEIVAFEPAPVPELRDALTAIAAVLEHMTVHFVALGAAAAKSCMFLPVVDGQTALEGGTLDPAHMERPWVIDGLHKLGNEIHTTVVPVSVMPLDHYLLAPAAIKIDVEGFERLVLEGGAETLRRHHPLLLIENNDWHNVTSYLAGFGYDCLRYLPEEDRLVPFFGQTTNAFYLPSPVKML